jgi:hypothetical protein
MFDKGDVSLFMTIVIRLLDSTGQELLDSISGDYEDSFCLESFEDLAKVYASSEPVNTRGWIIARVQTVDPKQPGKVVLIH